MSHELDLAFNLLDEAAQRLQARRYGTTPIADHNHGPILLISAHRYTRAGGHHLSLFAADRRGQIAVVEATAPNLRSEPDLRIRTVRAAHLTFHAARGAWTFRAHGRHTYTLSAHTGDSAWSLTIDDHPATSHEHIDIAIRHVLARELEPARTAALSGHRR